MNGHAIRNYTHDQTFKLSPPFQFIPVHIHPQGAINIVLDAFLMYLLRREFLNNPCVAILDKLCLRSWMVYAGCPDGTSVYGLRELFILTCLN